LPESGRIEDVGGDGLSLSWNLAESDGRIVVTAEVRDRSDFASGAELMVLPAVSSEHKSVTARADERGSAKLVLELDDQLRAQQYLLLRATLGAKSVTRKVRLSISSS
jgi:hypothetical protein